jgi:Holliday junction resolvase
MAYIKKVDKNQKDVVKTLRDYGADVYLLHMVGKGIPDLLVAYEGHTILIEVKDGAHKVFTPEQIKFITSWKGGHLYRVNSSEEAIDVLKSLKLE